MVVVAIGTDDREPISTGRMLRLVCREVWSANFSRRFPVSLVRRMRARPLVRVLSPLRDFLAAEAAGGTGRRRDPVVSVIGCVGGPARCRNGE